MSDVTLIEFLSSIAVMIPSNGDEAMRVDVIDPEERAVYVTGEESGEQYYIGFDEFNPDEHSFYKLQLVEFPKDDDEEEYEKDRHSDDYSPYRGF